jgi:hypothetical protein
MGSDRPNKIRFLTRMTWATLILALDDDRKDWLHSSKLVENGSLLLQIRIKMLK